MLKRKEVIGRRFSLIGPIGVRLSNSHLGNILVDNGTELSLIKKVKASEDMDPTLVELKKLVVDKNFEVFSQERDGVLPYQSWLCVPNVNGLREMILSEAHNSQYSIHP